MSLKLDLLDLKIVSELQLDSRISITELSRVGSSRPTVTSRLRRLRDEGIVLINGGLNINKFGFKIVCVGLEVRNDESRSKVEGYLKGCPRVLNIFRTPEKANIHVSAWGEDDQTLNSTIESLITINLEDETPCGKDCEKCYRYTNDRCLGCPSTAYYKNPLEK
jgi:DNA-binding Lrp family transcriptional regulator